MIRLFVIEDHTTVIVSSLKYMFRPVRDGISVSGSASSPDEAIGAVDPDTFDLIILDLYIPGFKPIDNIRRIREHFPGKPIVIYTSEKSESWKKRMMDEGAITYITKDAKRDELLLALRKAAKGEYLFYGKSGSAEKLSEQEDQISKVSNLLPLQNEIIQLLSEGLTHKEISKKTAISRSMIEKILKEVRDNFGVGSNMELIKLLTRLGQI